MTTIIAHIKHMKEFAGIEYENLCYTHREITNKEIMPLVHIDLAVGTVLSINSTAYRDPDKFVKAINDMFDPTYCSVRKYYKVIAIRKNIMLKTDNDGEFLDKINEYSTLVVVDDAPEYMELFKDYDEYVEE